MTDVKLPIAKPKSARRRSREFALQGLYEWIVSNEDAGAIHAHLMETPSFGKADAAYVDELLHGTIRSASILREALVPCLDRPIVELSPVEHAALLIACEELKNHPEVPYRVVINEAVELTKSFGGTDGFKYVNGVLDKVAPQWRQAEIAAHNNRATR
jgi:transcription antitermination protein NusB